jgi:hypothetical protein
VRQRAPVRRDADRAAAATRALAAQVDVVPGVHFDGGSLRAQAALDPVASECAPRPASAAEDLLRQRLLDRLPLDTSNAVRVPRPFFTHLEVWPDIVLPDLRVAVEYDTTGRDVLDRLREIRGDLIVNAWLA